MKTIFHWQKLSLFLLLLPAASLLVFPLACTKTYSVAPLSAQAVPTSTITPCGYPGNTCTPTFTATVTFTRTFSPTPTITFTRTITNTPPPTNTSTETGTPTNTFTITPTSTPTALPAPRGLYGLAEPSSGYCAFIWMKDTIPEITSYLLYQSSDGVNYTLIGSVPLSACTDPFCSAEFSTIGTNFNGYFYLTASNGGTPPDSGPSRVVHAVSGTAVTNTLTLDTFGGGTPVYHTIFSGTVVGGVKRVWYTDDLSAEIKWMWGEEAVSMTSINYGYSNTSGFTYNSAETLSSGVTYFINTFTMNNENWVIDWSYRGFRNP